MKQIKRMGHRRAFAAGVILMCVLAVFLLWQSQSTLTVTRYELASDILHTPVRLVQLADLHNSEFGKDNERLVRCVAGQKPDLILMTGDILNGREPDRAVVENLLRQLTDIAPVYFSYGNHEVTHESTYAVSLKDCFEQTGATVLERAYEDVTIKDQTIRLGGIFGFCMPERFSYETRWWECRFLREFQDTDHYTVLLAHLPTCWIENGILDDWAIDCVLCGHEHGGQIRIPLLGGLYAPDRGIFPGRTSGLFHSSDGERTMVLSRGLGSAVNVPRLFNIPEIVVIDLVPEGKTGEE